MTFAKQRVEGGAGLVAGIAKAIDAHARTGRRIEYRERAAGRPGLALFVHDFHVDAKLHGIATRCRHLGLRQPERGKRRAGRDRKLRFDEIDPEHFLGDGMLDLKPRVGLDEGKRLIAAGFAVDQEFKRAEAVIARGGRELLRGLDDARAQTVAQRRAGGDLDELLVAALDRAFAFPEMADRAVAVAEDLHLDMAGLADQPLDIDLIAAERRLGLGLAARIGLLQPGSILDHPHAAPATAGHGLDHDRGTGAERGEERPGLLQRGRTGGSLDDGNTVALRQHPRRDLVAEQIERFRRRPDEHDLFLGAAPRQQGVFAEKPVAWMQGIAGHGLGGGDHRLDVQIGTRAPPGNFMRLVGGANMQRERVVGRIDGDGGETGFAGGAGDADGDLASVGDQQFSE